MNIAYVILHYMAFNDTVECAESILRIAHESTHEVTVIIVDNGSSNNSFDLLKEKYDDEVNVILIHSNENLGFAKGNNIGFNYAKTICKADFIVLLNNDTVIEQKDFNEVLVKKYEQYQYDVLGPDIVTLDGCHQNPGREIEWTKTKLFIFRLKKQIQFFLANFVFMDKYLRINENGYSRELINRDVVDVTLHGACLVFSFKYISRFDGLYDGTFLYMEEDILRLRAKYYGYLMVYSPELSIKHKEDIATNMVSASSLEKKKSIYQNLLRSSNEYIKLKNKYEGKQR